MRFIKGGTRFNTDQWREAPFWSETSHLKHLHRRLNEATTLKEIKYYKDEIFKEEIKRRNALQNPKYKLTK